MPLTSISWRWPTSLNMLSWGGVRIPLPDASILRFVENGDVAGLAGRLKRDLTVLAGDVASGMRRDLKVVYDVVGELRGGLPDLAKGMPSRKGLGEVVLRCVGVERWDYRVFRVFGEEERLSGGFEGYLDGVVMGYSSEDDTQDDTEGEEEEDSEDDNENDSGNDMYEDAVAEQQDDEGSDTKDYIKVGMLAYLPTKECWSLTYWQ